MQLDSALTQLGQLELPRKQEKVEDIPRTFPPCSRRGEEDPGPPSVRGRACRVPLTQLEGRRSLASMNE